MRKSPRWRKSSRWFHALLLLLSKGYRAIFTAIPSRAPMGGNLCLKLPSASPEPNQPRLTRRITVLRTHPIHRPRPPQPRDLTNHRHEGLPKLLCRPYLTWSSGTNIVREGSLRNRRSRIRVPHSLPLRRNAKHPAPFRGWPRPRPAANANATATLLNGSLRSLGRDAPQPIRIPAARQSYAADFVQSPARPYVACTIKTRAASGRLA